MPVLNRTLEGAIKELWDFKATFYRHRDSENVQENRFRNGIFLTVGWFSITRFDYNGA